MDTLLNKTISHFHILEKLGEGGMGRVYKARDLVLQRFVALKFISPELLKDANALQRFHIEAVAASAINHPNICTIFEIGSQDGFDFIVMEYVEGKSLRAILEERGHLTLKEIRSILNQLCMALSGAHQKGIVHRDIKPDNILLTPDGHVKITDFGLAKLASEALEPKEQHDRDGFFDDALYLTSMSQHLGTLAYMSPEQLRHKKVDQRTDIFAIGTLLFELATGQRPFDHGNLADSVQAILESQFTIKNLDVKIPPQLAPVISDCLQKQPDDRPQSTEALLKLVRTKSRHYITKTILKWLVVFAIAVIFVIAALWFMHRQSELKQQRAYSTLEKVARPLITSKNTLMSGDLSPDGKHVIYLEYRQDERFPWLLLKNLHTGDITELTDGTFTVVDPCWSRDGTSIALARGNDSIWLYDLATRQTRKVSEVGKMPRWSYDDSKILCQQGVRPQKTKLYIVSVNNSRFQELKPSADSLSLMTGDWHPDGESIICLEGSGSRWSVIDLNVSTGEIIKLASDFSDIHSLRVAPDGSGIYYAANNLFKPTIVFASFDDLAAWPDCEQDYIWLDKSVRDFNLSSDGASIIFSTHEDRSNFVRFKIDVDGPIRPRDKEVVGRISEKYPVYAISPDSQYVALEDLDSRSRQIWLFDIKNKNKFQLTSGQECFAPSWSPDSRWLAFDRGGGEKADIWKISVDGSVLEPVIQHAGADWMPSWSPTNNYIAFLSSRSGDVQIWLHDLRTHEERQLTNETLQVWYPVWHPDGQHIAYALDNRGVKQVKMVNIETNDAHLFPTLKEYGGHPRLYFGFKRDGSSLYQYSYELFEYKLPSGPLSQLSNFRSENYNLLIGYTGFLDTRDGHLWGADYTTSGDIWLIENKK